MPSADVILCADSIYDPDACPALVGVLRELLIRPGNPVAYLSAQVRNPSSLQVFFEELTQKQLAWQFVNGLETASDVHFDTLLCREDVSEVFIVQIAATSA